MPPPSLSEAPSQLSIQDQSTGRSQFRIISGMSFRLHLTRSPTDSYLEGQIVAFDFARAIVYEV